MSRKRLSQRNAAGSMRREISPEFKYDPKKVKHIKKILHSTNVALGNMVSAYNEFLRVKSNISPDGKLGGLGYVMEIKSMKETLNKAIHALSEVADSLTDELTNPAWHVGDDADVKKLIKEKEDIEEQAEEAEGGNSEEIPEEENSETPEKKDEETEEKPAEEEPAEEESKDKSEENSEPEEETSPEQESMEKQSIDIDKIFPPETVYASKAAALDKKVREALKKSLR